MCSPSTNKSYQNELQLGFIWSLEVLLKNVEQLAIARPYFPLDLCLYICPYVSKSPVNILLRYGTHVNERMGKYTRKMQYFSLPGPTLPARTHTPSVGIENPKTNSSGSKTLIQLAVCYLLADKTCCHRMPLLEI